MILNRRTLTPYEQIEARAAAKYESFFASCYSDVTGEASAVAGFRDISDVLADAEVSCFVDFMHVGEDANAIIAEVMMHDLEPLFTTGH